MKQRNEPSTQARTLSPLDAIAASLVIDGTIWALLDTAPIAAAELDATEPFERRMRLGSRHLSPHVRFTAEEWERMSLEYFDAMRAAARNRHGTEHSGWGVHVGPKPRTDGNPPSPSVRGGGLRSLSR